MRRKNKSEQITIISEMTIWLTLRLTGRMRRFDKDLSQLTYNTTGKLEMTCYSCSK